MILDISNLSVKQLKHLNKLYNSLQSDFNLLVDKLYELSDYSIEWLTNSIVRSEEHTSELQSH